MDANVNDFSNVRESTQANAQSLTVQTHTISDGNERNTNNVVLTSSNASHTTWARAEVTTYQCDVVCVDVAEASSDETAALPLLGGAEYTMYRDLGHATSGSVSFSVQIAEKSETYYYNPDDALRFTMREGSYWLRRSDTQNAAGKNKADTTRLVTTTDGALNVRGLKAGTYVLVEEVAPEGGTEHSTPVALVVHSEPYTNTDIVEDNTPGLRHSNDEGDLTVTTQEGNTVRSDVYPWKAVTQGKPATYVRMYIPQNTTKSIRNGGVLIAGSVAAGVQPFGGMGLALIAVLVIVLAVVAILLARRRIR